MALVYAGQASPMAGQARAAAAGRSSAPVPTTQAAASGVGTPMMREGY
jgi:hypothetical protein